MQKIKRNLYLDIGFEEKSTICNERHSFIFSGISGISKRKKSRNNYLDIGLFEASTICKAIQFLMLSGISRRSKNKLKRKSEINSAMTLKVNSV